MKMGKQFQNAEQMGARCAAIVGTEFPDISLKNLADRSETKCTMNQLGDEIDSLIGT
jgi:histidyl-tRNA synthetase